jgi:hypothetical protein
MSFGRIILKGKTVLVGKYPVSVFSTSLIRTGMGLKLILCDDRPATNRLTHGMVLIPKLNF